MLSFIECGNCGLKLTPRNWRPPLHCACGQVVDVPADYVEPPLPAVVVPVIPTCQHRGPIAGSASCGCGVVYECGKLNVFCSDRKPVDQWATLTRSDGSSVTLADVGYQCCGECGEFSVQQPSSSL